MQKKFSEIRDKFFGKEEQKDGEQADADTAASKEESKKKNEEYQREHPEAEAAEARRRNQNDQELDAENEDRPKWESATEWEQHHELTLTEWGRSRNIQGGHQGPDGRPSQGKKQKAPSHAGVKR
jgi:hypothetical protein